MSLLLVECCVYGIAACTLCCGWQVCVCVCVCGVTVLVVADACCWLLNVRRVVVVLVVGGGGWRYDGACMPACV